MSNPNPLSRRAFFAKGAMLGFAGTPAVALAESNPATANSILNSKRPDAPYDLGDAENILYSACLQCNTGCGIKAKLQDGVVTKTDGNPYNPWTLLPHLEATVSADTAAKIDGAICPKGQAGLQTCYDPYRLRKVLKRAGQRGDNQWTVIPFAQAVKEICDGGKLFASVSGEESRHVEGLRDLMPELPAAVGKEMTGEIAAYWNENDKDKKAALLEAFRAKHAPHLELLIDPAHPDLGPKNNQIVCAWGRLKAGRSEFYKRFASALGTVNAHGHTTVCQGSLYFTCKAISEQWTDGKFSGGQKFYWQADLENSAFVLFVGANLFEANYGPPNRTVRLTDNLVNGRTRIAVADPRFSKLASKAWKWLPLKPGTDAPVALAMIRWIIENQAYDATFLAAANKAAAIAAQEASWSNASWLVALDPEGRPGKLVRAVDLGLAASDAKEVFVVRQENQFIAVDPNDEQNAVTGDLLVEVTLPDGSQAKSGLQILFDSAREHTIAEWCATAGVEEDDVIAVARELARAGKRGAVDIHRGPAQHTNGFYNVFAWMSLNMLLGNYDHKGGMIVGTTYDISGSKGKKFDLAAHPGKPATFGLSSIRHDLAYEKSSLFAGYPARRNWYPLSSDIYEEIIPSMGDAYPYGCKAFFLYMGAPTYALPAGHTNIEILRDPAKVPMFIANDILIGATSMYADYIFPDLSFLERWEFQGTHPNIPQKSQPIRQPVAAPMTDEVTVFGHQMPLSFEAMMLGIAEYLQLPGFGPDGFAPGVALQHPDDFYLRGVGNLAFGEKPDGADRQPAASEREVAIFRRARRHLPPSVYDEQRWRAIVGEDLFPRVVTVLNRGGRFESHLASYPPGSLVKNRYGKLLNLYQEKTAGVIHSGTGRKIPGYACHVPIRDFHGNEPTQLREGYDLALVTHRTISQCKTRTITNPWLTPLMPENAILLHPRDAERLGLKPGQEVKVVSATNLSGEWDIGPNRRKPMIGKVQLTQTVRPGVISFALGFGHWATGAADVVIDGEAIRGEVRRQAGLHANAAMWVDPALKNTCFLDPVGGSVSFYDTHVRLEQV